MNRTEPTDPLSQYIIRRNRMEQEELNAECVAPQHGYDEGAELRMLLDNTRNEYPHYRGPDTKFRYLFTDKRKRPNKAQRLARRVWNGMGDVIVWFLVLGGLAVFVYAVLGHGK